MPTIRQVNPAGLVLDRELFFSGGGGLPGGGCCGVAVVASTTMFNSTYTSGSDWRVNTFVLGATIKPFVFLGAFMRVQITSMTGTLNLSIGTNANPACLLAQSVWAGPGPHTNKLVGTRAADYTGTFLEDGVAKKFAAVRGFDPLFSTEVDSDTIQTRIDTTAVVSWNGQVQSFIMGFPLHIDLGEL